MIPSNYNRISVEFLEKDSILKELRDYLSKNGKENLNERQLSLLSKDVDTIANNEIAEIFQIY